MMLHSYDVLIGHREFWSIHLRQRIGIASLIGKTKRHLPGSIPDASDSRSNIFDSQQGLFILSSIPLTPPYFHLSRVTRTRSTAWSGPSAAASSPPSAAMARSASSTPAPPPPRSSRAARSWPRREPGSCGRSTASTSSSRASRGRASDRWPCTRPRI